MNSIKEPKPKNQEGPTKRFQTLLVFTRFEVLFRVVHYSYIDEEFDALCCGELYQFTVHEETFEPTLLACGSQLKVGTLLIVNI